ncbi:MAG: DNA internalization-related competence protein ComEC/Rec2 [Lachnospiraceae bacterium]|nr:DNA internalization-related competence protein ComEC/Rec2 [Lachnospiraceae bacterium]
MHIRRPLCVFSLFFTAVLLAILFATGEEGRLVEGGDALDGKSLTFEGTIEGIEEKNNRSVLQIKDISVSDSGILFYPEKYPETENKLHIGSRVRCEGRFQTVDEASNKGQFDLGKYYALKGYTHVVYGGRILSVSSSYDKIRERLRLVKKDATCVYEHYFDHDEYGVIEALVFADKSKLDRDIKEQYQNAGISHILALSGLHIVTLGFMLLALLRRIRIPLVLSAVLTITVMLLYCLMTGMPVSALRALIMFMISVAALLSGRTYDLRTSSAMAAVIMLMINPDHVYDSGFLLSFSSILGIGFVYPGIREAVMNIFEKVKVKELHRSERWYIRVAMALLRTLLFSASLQLALMPFTMWFFYQLPAYGIFVNLIAVPLAGVLLFACIATGIFGCAAVFCTHCRIISGYVAMSAVYITRGILRLYDMVTCIVEKVPGSIWITGRPKVWQIVIYYLFLISAVIGGCLLVVRSKENRSISRRRAVYSLLLCFAGTVILFIRIRPECEVSALSVGQGQCFVIHGQKVPTVIYDCGSTDEKEVGKYRLLSFLKFNGIDTVDTIFVSHLDSDHVNGVIELLKENRSGIRVKRIVISGTKAQKESDNYPLLREAAAERSIPVYSMLAGDNVKWDHLYVTCLWPDEAGMKMDTDLNESSLVLSVEYDNGDDRRFRALFTGDISSAAEEALLASRSVNAHYDYLQVAHHGSRFSASAAFMEQITPSVAVISAGENNKYGHPHEETLRLLEKFPCTHTCITCRDGETDCDIKDGKLSIFLFK